MSNIFLVLGARANDKSTDDPIEGKTKYENEKKNQHPSTSKEKPSIEVLGEYVDPLEMLESISNMLEVKLSLLNYKYNAFASTEKLTRIILNGDYMGGVNVAE